MISSFITVILFFSTQIMAANNSDAIITRLRNELEAARTNARNFRARYQAEVRDN